MQSLRFVGTACVLAMATVTPNSALAQSFVPCSRSSPSPAYATHDADCQITEATLAGMNLFFGTFGTRSNSAFRGHSSVSTSPRVEYFRGGPPIDVFRVGLMGSPIQNAFEGGDLFSRLFWQELFAGGPQASRSRGPAEVDDSPGHRSRRVESNGAPGTSGDAWKNPHWDDVTSLDPSEPSLPSLPPVTSLDLPLTSLDPVPVIANPEPASIFLIASGMVGLGAMKMRRRRGH